ncbi:MAG TPA: ROK family protein [Streptosporangiaceae bacterium]|nr:ROK family protein [Streptosporangiaceae bacterium]
MSGLTAGAAGLVIACDVGGTGIKAALVDTEGRVERARTVPTPVVDGDGDATAKAVLGRVAELVSDLARAAVAGGRGAPAGIGVIVPGLVDAAAGVARYAENLGWRDVPFAARLGEATGLPVAFDHDVRAAGAAEQQLGAGRGHRDVAFVPIGTGIAAALVLDGRPYAGGGWAGEIGHIDVGSGLPCPCGATGCLETIASAAAIARRYSERSGRPVAGALDVAGLLGRGDADARVVWDEAVDALAFVLAVTAAVAAPELIVIGGGLSGAGDVLLDPLRRGLAARVTTPQRHPELCRAALGEQAGLLGAALLAWRQAGVDMQGPGR